MPFKGNFCLLQNYFDVLVNTVNHCTHVEPATYNVTSKKMSQPAIELILQLVIFSDQKLIIFVYLLLSVHDTQIYVRYS